MNAKLTPYLGFNSRCREAMEFYQGIFGGELQMQTYGEADSGMEVAPEHEDRVMHALLSADGMTFMASDGHPDMEIPFGTNVSLSINGTDEALLRGWFEALAEGGEITMPLEKQFWGDQFGMVTDQFGMQWMVNISVNNTLAIG